MIAISKRLALRFYRAEDLLPIFENYTGDLDSSKYLARAPHTEIEQTKRMFQRLSTPDSIALTGKCIWVVDATRERGAIGLVTAIKSDDAMIVHFGIGRPYRGRGYAAEALATAVEHLLVEDPETSISSFTDVENVAAQRALVNAGFLLTRRARQFYQAPQLNGEYRDVFHYEFRA